MKRAWILALVAGCTSSQLNRSGSDSFPPADPRLRAGEVDDNRKPADYERYFRAYPEQDVRKIDITDRMILAFVDRDGRPVPFEPVSILADGCEVYRAVTTAAGQVRFPPRAVGACARSFEARIADRCVRFERGEDRRLEVDVPSWCGNEVNLDVAFCLDTTGSMDDEIDRLTATLRDVARRVDALEPRPRIRWGLVEYRDRGDEYVTRITRFTDDLGRFLSELRHVRAGGGGDYPEAVNAGLHRAVSDLEWRCGPAIRLLFLIGDAPPQMYADDVPYTTSMRRAVERGIKIHTLAASGLDDRGEFVWRQLAQFTLGTFFFLSYGGSTRHHVGGYRENNLDDLLVRAVRSELEALRARPRRQDPSWGQGRAPDDFREWRGQRDY